MSGFAHVMFLILTIIFPPLVIFWIIAAVSSGNNRKKKDRELMERQTAAMEKLADIQKWRSYRD